jgi:hypothetical protein
MANARQVHIFDTQPQQAMITIRENHELMMLSDMLPWIELIDMAASVRATKIKGVSGRQPHYRELLGAVALMGVRNITYRQAEDLIAHYAPARYLCGLMDTSWQPDHITIFEFTQMLGDEGMRAINAQVLLQAQGLGILDPTRLMSDTTAQESMTPYPTEVGLMKRYADLVTRNLKGVGGKMNSIKRRAKEIGKKLGGLVRNSHLFARGKEAKQKVGKKIYHTAKELQKLVKDTIAQGRQLTSKSGVELQRLNELMDRLFPQILHFLKTGFVASGKIIHLQVPELYSIVRGKAGKSVEFGIKWGVNLVDGFAQGFVMDEVKNASDQKFCIQSIEEHADVFGEVPKVLGFDRGGYSKANIGRAKKVGVEQVGIAPKGKAGWAVSKKQAERIRRERAQVEGLIGNLKSKKYGFNKPNAKSVQAMQTYGHRSILGFNMLKMIRKLNTTEV